MNSLAHSKRIWLLLGVAVGLMLGSNCFAAFRESKRCEWALVEGCIYSTSPYLDNLEQYCDRLLQLHPEYCQADYVSPALYCLLSIIVLLILLPGGGTEPHHEVNSKHVEAILAQNWRPLV